MATEIKAVQCPKCGSTQNTEIRPDYFRCSSCGTEYFLDNGVRPTVIQQAASVNPGPPASNSKMGCVVGASILVVLIVVVGIVAYLLSSNNSSSSSASAGSDSSDFRWDYSWDGHLYLSADGKPVFFTPATKEYNMGLGKKVDYASFTDVSTGQEIKLVPMPGNEQMTHEHGNTTFNVKEFSNGDIYILSDNTVISRVRKNAYTVTDVTKTLFEDHPELISGIAKADFVDEDLGEGFNLFTNDGKNYFYFPLTHKLYTKETIDQARPGNKIIRKDGIQKTGFGFSGQYNYDFPELSYQLIAYRYIGGSDTSGSQAPVYHNFKYGDDRDLKNIKLVSHTDFTPGRIYFAQGMIYYDDDYILISYRLNPGKNAVRYVQCLNAHDASIVFTTRLDEDYPPDQCVRYKDGFAMSTAKYVYSLSFAGKLSKYTPEMYKAN